MNLESQHSTLNTQHSTLNTVEIPKNNAFNALRLFFALVVVLYHCIGHYRTLNEFESIIFDGHIAVCAFFIISGFWITKSYFSSASLKNFYIKRIKKILPMYYLSILLFSIVCFFVSNLSIKEYFNSEYVKYLFCNAIFLNFLHKNLPGCFFGDAVNGALWTIKIEIGFYLILPLIMHFWEKIKTRRMKNLYLTILYTLSILYSIGIAYLSRKIKIPTQLVNQLPTFIAHFISGMVIYLNWDIIFPKLNKIILPFIIIFILHYFTKTEIFLPISLAFIIVFLALRLKFLFNIGKNIDFSWGLYLFHFPLMQILYFSGISKLSPTIYLVSVISIAFVITYVVEVFFQRKIK